MDQVSKAPTFVALIVFLITFGLYILRSWKRSHASGQPQATDDDLQRALHTFKTSTLATRASNLASDPLENLFRLRNPFVSASYPLQRRYREALLRQFVQTNADDWVAIARTTAAAVQPHLCCKEGPGQDRYIALRDASRNVTLAAVLRGLFGIDNVDHATLVYIGTEIHDLVVAKKKFNASPTSATDSQVPQALRKRADQLIVTLRRIFSSAKTSSPLVKAVLCTSSDDNEEEANAEFNPLNLVIPSFEAPWRAVFYTLLATLQQSPANCRDVLTLRDSSPSSPPSSAAIAIVHEVLRLYPPIRRVRRSTPVDIERLQRDEKYWGPSALKFSPSRFLNDDGYGDGITIPSSAWLPFAAGSMKCPSANGYSARLVVTIAGEMLRQFFPQQMQPSWRLEGEEWDEAAQRGDILRAGRKEYAGVKLHVGLTR